MGIYLIKETNRIYRLARPSTKPTLVLAVTTETSCPPHPYDHNRTCSARYFLFSDLNNQKTTAQPTSTARRRWTLASLCRTFFLQSYSMRKHATVCRPLWLSKLTHDPPPHKPKPTRNTKQRAATTWVCISCEKPRDTVD